ncbi:hypothetical protein AB0F42_30225 [Streptomyces buecherae]|uniref:hypothetical protein n=1 Tax=Streptomyces buecherae TaxID=2763006 RepID=UPI003408A3AE
MNRNSLRASAATVMAAVLIGLAAPTALATEAPRSTSTAQLSLTASQARELLASPEVNAELGREGRAAVQSAADGIASAAVERGAASSAGKAIIALSKKQGPKLFKQAVVAAKKGTKSFEKWAKDLPWYHPVHLAITTSGAGVIDWVVKQLI